MGNVSGTGDGGLSIPRERRMCDGNAAATWIGPESRLRAASLGWYRIDDDGVSVGGIRRVPPSAVRAAVRTAYSG